MATERERERERETAWLCLSVEGLKSSRVFHSRYRLLRYRSGRSKDREKTLFLLSLWSFWLLKLQFDLCRIGGAIMTG